MTTHQLQKKHPRFIYESFSYSLDKRGLVCGFRFKIEPDIYFNPKVIIRGVDTFDAISVNHEQIQGVDTFDGLSAGKKSIKKISGGVLKNFVFHLGLAEIPSYWKCATSPIIEIRAGHLNSEQIKWWKGLLMNGLAEFFYKNGIKPSSKLFKIVSSGKKTFGGEKTSSRGKGFLVPVGGGKDSLVALKIIKRAGGKMGTMVLGDVKASNNLIKSLGLKQPIKIERKIDKKLIALNKKGYPNGHTPFSSYLAFLSIFCARIFGYGAVVVGNERSANEPNIFFGDKKINHQYSKSYEFEKSFRSYIKKHLTGSVDYFSIMRPLYELQITSIAAKYPKKLAVTRSCNVNMKKNSWCGKCPKCLSVYLLLYPFLGDKKTEKMFGKNLFNDKNLWKYIPALVGGKTEKPFDCVATRKENMAALTMAVEKMGGNLPYILKKFKNTYGEKPISGKTIAKIMLSWDKKNFLPRDMVKVLKRVITTS